MRHRRCISAILMSFVLFLQPVYAVPPEENQPENSQENNTENEKRQQEQISAPSAILMEASTGQIIYEKNPDEKLPPASVTKVMTLLLIFDALESGQIKLADEVTTSEYAASMGGSQVFLEPGETQTVDTLIKCISVASANDACVSIYLWKRRRICCKDEQTGKGSWHEKYTFCKLQRIGCRRSSDNGKGYCTDVKRTDHYISADLRLL